MLQLISDINKENNYIIKIRMRMDNDRNTSSILFALAWRMRRLCATLDRAKRTITSNNFDQDEWSYTNYQDLNGVRQMLNQYQNVQNGSQTLIIQFEGFNFFWHHLIDAIERASHQWRLNHLYLIEERMNHAQMMETMCRNEMTIVDHRIRANEMANGDHE